MYKLGKLAPVDDHRNFEFSKYFTPSGLSLPIPKYSNWSEAVPLWPMYGNDKVGDCTWAGAAHAIQLMTYNSDQPFDPTEKDILQCYQDVSGYDPANPEFTDNGELLSNVLKYWRKTGIAGHKIGAYMKVDHRNLGAIHAALYLFGGLYIGLAMPICIEGQLDKKLAWDVEDYSLNGDAAPGSWGGHCVVLAGYTAYAGQGYFIAISWGEVYLLSSAFLNVYCDEIWAIVSDDWVNKTGKTPNGLDMPLLLKDLSKVS